MLILSKHQFCVLQHINQILFLIQLDLTLSLHLAYQTINLFNFRFELMPFIRVLNTGINTIGIGQKIAEEEISKDRIRINKINSSCFEGQVFLESLHRYIELQIYIQIQFMRSRVKITNTSCHEGQTFQVSVRNTLQNDENLPQTNLHNRLYSFAELDEPTFNYNPHNQAPQNQFILVTQFCQSYLFMKQLMHENIDNKSHYQRGLNVCSLSKILMLNTWDRMAVREVLEEQRSLRDQKVDKHICERMHKYLRIFDRFQLQKQTKISPISHSHHTNPSKYQSPSLISHRHHQYHITSPKKFPDSDLQTNQKSNNNRFSYRQKFNEPIQRYSHGFNNQRQEFTERYSSTGLNLKESRNTGYQLQRQRQKREYVRASQYNQDKIPDIMIDQRQQNFIKSPKIPKNSSENPRKSRSSKKTRIQVKNITASVNTLQQKQSRYETKKQQERITNISKNKNKLKEKEKEKDRQKITINKPVINKKQKYTIGKNVANKNKNNNNSKKNDDNKSNMSNKSNKAKKQQLRLYSSRIRQNNRSFSKSNSNSKQKSISRSRFKSNLQQIHPINNPPPPSNLQHPHHQQIRSQTPKNQSSPYRELPSPKNSRFSPKKYRNIVEQTVYKSNCFINMLKLMEKS